MKPEIWHRSYIENIDDNLENIQWNLKKIIFSGAGPCDALHKCVARGATLCAKPPPSALPLLKGD